MRDKKIIIAITALSLAALLLSACGFNQKDNIPEMQDGDGMERTAYPLSEAVYPEMSAYPAKTGRGMEGDYNSWLEDVSAQRRDLSFTGELNEFYAKIIAEFLSDSRGENKIVSPLNLYMALSMLAEITDGETRTEIMNLINCPDEETLRSRASDLWNSHYRRDGLSSLTLANSLWLRNDMEYNETCLKALADNYYASSFAGSMGSDEYNELLRSWLNEQTEGLLQNSVQEEGFDEETYLALVSTICCRAKWADKFDGEATAPGSFHGIGGDIETEFMHGEIQDTYSWGKNFGAVSLPLDNLIGEMEFILPDEGSDIDELLGDGEFLSFIISGGSRENEKFIKINLSVPKFDIEAESELTEGLKNLGVKRVFDTEADFSPITAEENLYLSKVNHAVRVAVDEEGVKAAAYTVMQAAGACAPPEDEMDFTLDRPFIFIIRSEGGQPLFVGTVYNP